MGLIHMVMFVIFYMEIEELYVHVSNTLSKIDQF